MVPHTGCARFRCQPSQPGSIEHVWVSLGRMTGCHKGASALRIDIASRITRLQKHPFRHRAKLTGQGDFYAHHYGPLESHGHHDAELAGVLHRDERVVRTEHRLRGLVREFLVDATAASVLTS